MKVSRVSRLKVRLVLCVVQPHSRYNEGFQGIQIERKIHLTIDPFKMLVTMKVSRVSRLKEYIWAYLAQQIAGYNEGFQGIQIERENLKVIQYLIIVLQ